MIELKHPKIQTKIDVMIELLQVLKNYQPSYSGQREAQKLRYWSQAISEDIQYVTEFYIKEYAYKNNGDA